MRKQEAVSLFGTPEFRCNNNIKMSSGYGPITAFCTRGSELYCFVKYVQFIYSVSIY